MTIERYVVQSLTVHSGFYHGVLSARVHDVDDRADQSDAVLMLSDREGCRLKLDGRAIDRHALLRWIADARNPRVEVDRDEADYGLITEARFSRGES